jgi:hypothetical protein
MYGNQDEAEKQALTFPKNLPFLYVTLDPASYISSGIFCLSSSLAAIICNKNVKYEMAEQWRLL